MDNSNPDDEKRVATARAGLESIHAMQAELYGLRRELARVRADRLEINGRANALEEANRSLLDELRKQISINARLAAAATQAHIAISVAQEIADSPDIPEAQMRVDKIANKFSAPIKPQDAPLVLRPDQAINKESPK